MLKRTKSVEIKRKSIKQIKKEEKMKKIKDVNINERDNNITR